MLHGARALQPYLMGMPTMGSLLLQGADEAPAASPSAPASGAFGGARAFEPAWMSFVEAAPDTPAPNLQQVAQDLARAMRTDGRAAAMLLAAEMLDPPSRLHATALRLASVSEDDA